MVLIMVNRLEEVLGEGITRVKRLKDGEITYYVDTHNARGLDNAVEFKDYVQKSMDIIIEDSKKKRVFEYAQFVVLGKYGDCYCDTAEEICEEANSAADRLKRTGVVVNILSYFIKIAACFTGITLGTAFAENSQSSIKPWLFFEEELFAGAIGGVLGYFTAEGISKTCNRLTRSFYRPRDYIGSLRERADDYSVFIDNIEVRDEI